ncbi:hypothetical protein BGZ67_009277 [Mortierella alpina]|nr:hypothetical protein BGZ67_009277 [Mortierella alpina]
MGSEINLTVPQAHVDWLKQKISEGSPITLPEFALSFDYFSKEDAEEDFSALLSKSFIANSVKNGIRTKFENWKRNDGDNFWATRVATISKTRTATELVAGSVPVAKGLIWDSTSSSQRTKELESNIPIKDKQSTRASNGKMRRIRQQVLEVVDDHATAKRQRLASHKEHRSLDNDISEDGTVHAAKSGAQSELFASPGPSPGYAHRRTPLQEATGSCQLPRIRSEDVSSPVHVYNSAIPDNPFVEDEEHMLPSIVANDFQFKGCIGDHDFGDAFKAYHDSCLTRKIAITKVQDVLSRSGILFLDGTYSPRLLASLGRQTTENISRTFTRKFWPDDIDLSEDRREVRDWINAIEDNDHNWTDLATGGQENRKLRLYLLNALERLQVETTNTPPEASLMSRYVTPLLEVFLNDPALKVVLDTPNTMAGAVKHRKQKSEQKQGKRPDIRQGIVDDSGEMIFETGYGEIKSGHHNPDSKKSAPVARDLVRVGLLMKDELDAAEDLYDVTSALALGMQVTGYTFKCFLMAKVGNLYIMKAMSTMAIPNDIKSLSTIASDYKSWRQLKEAARRGIHPLIEAMNTGKKGTPHVHFPTTTSPDAKSIKNK